MVVPAAFWRSVLRLCAQPPEGILGRSVCIGVVCTRLTMSCSCTPCGCAAACMTQPSQQGAWRWPGAAPGKPRTPFFPCTGHAASTRVETCICGIGDSMRSQCSCCFVLSGVVPLVLCLWCCIHGTCSYASLPAHHRICFCSLARVLWQGLVPHKQQKACSLLLAPAQEEVPGHGQGSAKRATPFGFRSQNELSVCLCIRIGPYAGS